jgi:hypothetical protein
MRCQGMQHVPVSYQSRKLLDTCLHRVTCVPLQMRE